jgi:hypothetical protein
LFGSVEVVVVPDGTPPDPALACDTSVLQTEVDQFPLFYLTHPAPHDSFKNPPVPALASPSTLVFLAPLLFTHMIGLQHSETEQFPVVEVQLCVAIEVGIRGLIIIIIIIMFTPKP